MGYEMSKPNLRAELEADLKLVSEGRKDKRSVLQQHIQKYKTVFIESARKAKKLVTFCLLVTLCISDITHAGLSGNRCWLVVGLTSVTGHFLLLPQVR